MQTVPTATRGTARDHAGHDAVEGGGITNMGPSRLDKRVRGVSEQRHAARRCRVCGTCNRLVSEKQPRGRGLGGRRGRRGRRRSNTERWGTGQSFGQRVSRRCGTHRHSFWGPPRLHNTGAPPPPLTRTTVTAPNVTDTTPPAALTRGVGRARRTRTQAVTAASRMHRRELVKWPPNLNTLPPPLVLPHPGKTVPAAPWGMVTK